MKISCIRLSIIFFFLAIVSCSSNNDNENESSEKQLVKITYEYFADNFKRARDIEYDSQGRIVLITNDQGGTVNTYKYNADGKLFKSDFFDYNSQTNMLQNKEVTEYTFNADNKISGVKETYSYYDTSGNFISESSVLNEVTYSENMMIRLSKSHDYKTEFQFNNKGLIDLIKVYRSDVLKSNMSFIYDAEGNCIFGTGPIDEGSLDSTTDNINLSVIYEEGEKHPVFNQFFEYEILSTGQGFHNLMGILIKQQGTKYAKEIEWYQHNDYTYKEVYNHSFENGYPTNVSLSDLPKYVNFGAITYFWD